MLQVCASPPIVGGELLRPRRPSMLFLIEQTAIHRFPPSLEQRC